MHLPPTFALCATIYPYIRTVSISIRNQNVVYILGHSVKPLPPAFALCVYISLAAILIRRFFPAACLSYPGGDAPRVCVSLFFFVAPSRVDATHISSYSLLENLNRTDGDKASGKGG